MRHISFMLTTAQFRDKSKTVTRRIGWKNLKAGDVLMACEKCQGIPKGGKVVKLGKIRVKSVRFERLDAMMKEPYGTQEAVLEGFPTMDGAGFVWMFCEHNGGPESREITRIEFEYV